MREGKVYGIEKKVFSLILTLALLLSVVPVPALAAGTPAEANGIYQIGTAEELLWFAQEVNGGNTGISGVLTADIDLTGTDWPGIGSSECCFAGSFDGQGHTVTFKDAAWGLFGYVRGSEGAVAIVKNVRTKGSIDHSGIAHEVAYAHFENCINGATITANETRAAGVIGSAVGVRLGNGTTANDVKITNCGNEASVTGLSNVAGIIGWTNVNTRVENCYNTGNINGKEVVGGIAGFLQESFRGETYVRNCYNTGTVTGTDYVAGIAGDVMNGVDISGCYNAGKAHYAIAGYVYNNTVTINGCFFLGTASAKSSPDYAWYTEEEMATRATAVSGAEMATADFAALLGSAYKVSCPYPVLSWQQAKEHTGSVCNNCKLGSTEKEIYDVTFQQHDGFTMTGADKATQGEAYSFSFSLNDGYKKDAGFAVKINGEVIVPTSDGKYTVLNVKGPMSVTAVDVVVIPGSYSINLPGAGYGYRAEGEKTVKAGEAYSFTLSFVDGFKAGSDLRVVAQQVLTQAQINKGIEPEEILLTEKDGMYTISAVDFNCRILVSGVVAVPTVAPVTVNFTVTEGWYEFHEPNDSGEVLIDKTLTVPYFDLSLYGLEKYYYDPYCYLDEDGNIRNIQQKGTPETAYDQITVMHAFIAATERFYLGYSQDQVGTGASYKKNPAAFKAAISWSQDAGSSFMDLWDHGTNLNYYVNYAYPLAYPGWGSTSDQIVMKNGDVISVHLITGVGSGSNFGFFTANDTNNKYDPGTDVVNKITVDQGEKVKLTYFWTATSGNYNTSYKLQKNKQLYWIYVEEDGVPGRVEPYELEDDNGDPYYEGGWRNEPLGKNTVLKTDSNGVVTIDTAGLEPGTYYIGGIGGFEAGGGADNAGYVSAGSEAGASFFKIVVQEYNGKLGDVNGDTAITGADATMLQRYIAKLIDDVNDSIADVNGDGAVTGADVTMIQRYVAKLIDSFPAES